MKYRKRPVVIDAVEWRGTLGTLTEWPDWFQGAVHSGVIRGFRGDTEPPSAVLVIGTLEGDHQANPGDYIICGIKGELYPCKPDIFTATYEEVAG